MKAQTLTLLLLAGLLLIIPVSAEMVPFYPDQGWSLLNPFPDGSDIKEFEDVTAISYNSVDDSLGITNIYVNVVQGTNIDYVLHFNDDSTITGAIDYSAEWLGLQDTLTVTLDGNSNTRSGPHVPGINPSIRIGYMVENNTIYNLQISDTLQYAIYDPKVSISADSPTSNPIIQIDIISENQPFDAQIHASSIEVIAQAENNYQTGSDQFIGFITKNVGAIFEILLLLWGYFRFFFIDHLLLTLLLVEGAILAYRMNSSPDIFVAISHVMTDNEKLIMGLIWFVQKVVEVAWDTANLLNPLRWVFGK